MMKRIISISFKTFLDSEASEISFTSSHCKGNLPNLYRDICTGLEILQHFHSENVKVPANYKLTPISNQAYRLSNQRHNSPSPQQTFLLSSSFVHFHGSSIKPAERVYQEYYSNVYNFMSYFSIYLGMISMVCKLTPN